MSGWQQDLFSEDFDTAKLLGILIPSEAAKLQRSRTSVRHVGDAFDKKRQANRDSARRCRARKTRHVESVVKKAGNLHETQRRLATEAKENSLEIDALKKRLQYSFAQMTLCEEEQRRLKVERDYLHRLVQATEGKQGTLQKEPTFFQKASEDHHCCTAVLPGLQIILESKVMADEKLSALADSSELFANDPVSQDHRYCNPELPNVQCILRSKVMAEDEILALADSSELFANHPFQQDCRRCTPELRIVQSILDSKVMADEETLDLADSSELLANHFWRTEQTTLDSRSNDQYMDYLQEPILGIADL